MAADNLKNLLFLDTTEPCSSIDFLDIDHLLKLFADQINLPDWYSDTHLNFVTMFKCLNDAESWINDAMIKSYAEHKTGCKVAAKTNPVGLYR